MHNAYLFIQVDLELNSLDAGKHECQKGEGMLLKCLPLKMEMKSNVLWSLDANEIDTIKGVAPNILSIFVVLKLFNIVVDIQWHARV